MVNLHAFGMDLLDQVVARGEQGKVEVMVAGEDEGDEGDGDDEGDKDDERDCPEFIQGSSRK